MAAFQFPPFALSSGVQRTLRFVQHLPECGWTPLVLTARARAYTAVSSDLVAEVPPDVTVVRACALDAARHLSIAGRYPGAFGRPDRWRSWAWFGVAAGMRLIRRFRPDVIWSTYPIATAHLIAHRLHRLSGVPLVADFRDPMAQEGYPADRRTREAFLQIERDLARHAARLVFVTPGARALYEDRYPEVPAGRFATIENGFDEAAFEAAERQLRPEPLHPGTFTLLHSGIVYPSERDPTALFRALGRMRADGRITPERLRIRFRAPVHDDIVRRSAVESKTSDLIEILPPIPYRDALEEMLRADGLLVMQGANCNEQIPAKLYEYLRARRPVLGLADPAGDTGKALSAAGVSTVATLEDSGAVERAIGDYLTRVRPEARPLPFDPRVAALSRRSRTRELASLLDAVRATSAAA